MNKPAARITALSLSLLLLAACATTGPAPTTSPGQQAAIALLEQGKPREAAQQLEAEAALVRGAARSQLLADAAFAWHEANDDARQFRAFGLGQLGAEKAGCGDGRGSFDELTTCLHGGCLLFEWWQ